MVETTEDKILAKMRCRPKFLVENEDGTYTIETKNGTFILEEQIDKVYEQCEILSLTVKKSVEKLLAVRSIIEPKVTDEDFENFKASTTIRLVTSIMFIYGLNDFL